MTAKAMLPIKAKIYFDLCNVVELTAKDEIIAFDSSKFRDVTSPITSIGTLGKALAAEF